MDKNTKFILEQVSDLHSLSQATIYNIRENGKLIARSTDDDVDIVTKKDKDGIDIVVKSNTKNNISEVLTIYGIIPR